MNASELMTRAVKTCSPNDSLQRAMQIMWEHDCGVVPVVDADSKVVGMITDRDVAIAAYTQGRPLWQIPVSSPMSEADCDSIPVFDRDGCLVGFITALDVCVAAYRQCRPLWHMDVGSAMSKVGAAATEALKSCRPRAAQTRSELRTARLNRDEES